MLIVILGGGIDLQGNLPPLVYQRLDKAIELYQFYPDAKVVVSGKYSFRYDQSHQMPRHTEASQMAKYLISKKIPQEAIVTEEESKDTIGNAYYLKKYVFLPRGENTAIIISSQFHLSRVEYIFHKIFGPGFNLQFVGTNDTLSPYFDRDVVAHQEELLGKTKQFLDTMKDGDHEFVADKFYKVGFYLEKVTPEVKRFVAEGK